MADHSTPTQRYQSELEELYGLDERFRHAKRRRKARSYVGALYEVTVTRRRQRQHQRLTYTVALAVTLLFSALGVTWLLFT